jgi:hypothetical protein
MIFSVKHPQPRIDHRTMNAHFCDVTQYDYWSTAQSANGDEVRYSNLAFMCFAENALVEASLVLARRHAFCVIRWWATRCRFTLATWRFRPSTLQAHTTRPSSKHSRTSSTTSPRRRRRSRRSSHRALPSLFDSGILQPFELGAGNELEPMGASQCGNDRTGFGVHSVTQNMRAYNIIRVQTF